jgi:hypothetical protein
MVSLGRLDLPSSKHLLVFHFAFSFRGLRRSLPICSISPADAMTRSKLIAGTLCWSIEAVYYFFATAVFC